MDTDNYRAIMRHQAGAVTVIACGAVNDRSGLTATAVASLSDRPPTLLACVNRGAGAHDEIVRANAFSVNLLSAEQQDVAERFAGKGGLKGEARFGGLDWRTLATGSPILCDALASLDCELLEQHTFTTHSIFMGRVVAGQFRADAKPLLYFRGDYWDLARGAAK
jgi:flavin reductase (DIM6/NTAB) family NADH-FMN oxidoreductase RutF